MTPRPRNIWDGRKVSEKRCTQIRAMVSTEIPGDCRETRRLYEAAYPERDTSMASSEYQMWMQAMTCGRGWRILLENLTAGMRERAMAEMDLNGYGERTSPDDAARWAAGYAGNDFMGLVWTKAARAELDHAIDETKKALLEAVATDKSDGATRA